MNTQERLDLSSLTENGDTLELADGRMLRLRIVPDEDASINDYDSDGKVAWGKRTDRGEQRPDGFTGAAEKLGIYSGGVSLWWEPMPGLDIDRGSAAWRQERARIRDLAEYGFKGVILELCQGKDAYGRPIIINTASLWAVDELYPELVSELYDELGVEA